MAAYGLGWDPVPQRLEQGSLLVRRAMELDPGDPLAHSALAGILLWTGRAEEVVVAAAKRAVDLRPTSDSTTMKMMKMSCGGIPPEPRRDDRRAGCGGGSAVPGSSAKLNSVA